MNLPQLHYFRKLAQLEHYTKAAQELFISQPSLSASISSMEEELQVKLFQKTGRNVRLTKEGKEFYHYVCRALDTLQEGIDLAHERRGALGGSVDVGCVPSLLARFVPDLLTEYQKQCPNQTRFDLFPCRGERGIPRGGGRHLRHWFLHVPGSVLTGQLSGCAAALCGRHAPAGIPWQAILPFPLSHLAGRPLLAPAPDSPFGTGIRSLLESQGIAVDWSFQDPLSIYGYLVQRKSMIAVTPAPIMPTINAAFVSIPLSDLPRDPSFLYLVYGKERHLSRPIKRFLEFLKESHSLSS